MFSHLKKNRHSSKKMNAELIKQALFKGMANRINKRNYISFTKIHSSLPGENLIEVDRGWDSTGFYVVTYSKPTKKPLLGVRVTKSCCMNSITEPRSSSTGIHSQRPGFFESCPRSSNHNFRSPPRHNHHHYYHYNQQQQQEQEQQYNDLNHQKHLVSCLELFCPPLSPSLPSISSSLLVKNGVITVWFVRGLFAIGGYKFNNTFQTVP